MASGKARKRLLPLITLLRKSSKPDLSHNIYSLIISTTPTRRPVHTTTGTMLKTYSTIDDMGPLDVLCGIDAKVYNTPGNIRFSQFIDAYLPPFLNSDSKKQEMMIQVAGSYFKFYKKIRIRDDNKDRSDALIVELDDEKSRAIVAHALLRRHTL